MTICVLYRQRERFLSHVLWMCNSRANCSHQSPDLDEVKRPSKANEKGHQTTTITDVVWFFFAKKKVYGAGEIHTTGHGLLCNSTNGCAVFLFLSFDIRWLEMEEQDFRGLCRILLLSFFHV